MARRSASTTAPESTEEIVVTESTTEVPTEVTPEAVEATAEAVEAEVAADAPSEPAAPAEVDLAPFTTALDVAVEARDTSTGDVPVEPISGVQAAYRAIEGLKGKNQAKALVAERMKAAMNALDITSARAYMVVTESLSAPAAKATAERTPADPKAAFTERYQALLLAAELVAAEAPEGVDVSGIALTDEQRNQAQTLLAHSRSDAEDKGDAPESSPVVRSAVKLSTGKATTGGRKAGAGTGAGGGVRRDIAQHIQSAFAGVEPGTFLTVAEIRTHQSEEYGSESPSAGAISARLFPASGKSTVAGVEPGTNDKGVRGATKL